MGDLGKCLWLSQVAFIVQLCLGYWMVAKSYSDQCKIDALSLKATSSRGALRHNDPVEKWLS